MGYEGGVAQRPRAGQGEKTMGQTADQMALRIMIGGGSEASVERKLAALLKAVREQESGGECPACGHAGPHDDNGERGAYKTFCCTACGEHFDAPEVNLVASYCEHDADLPCSAVGCGAKKEAI